jgi:RNA polymerase sigma-70 factor (ECF subfamily)
MPDSRQTASGSERIGDSRCQARGEGVAASGATGGNAGDDELMRRIGVGDAGAARLVVEQHLPALVALARHMLKSDSEAEDVAQEAFVRLWKQAPQWQPGRALIKTWLRRVASNLCIDRLRSQRGVPLDPGDDWPVAPRQQAVAEEQQLVDRVNAALKTLPERQRLALTLSHYQGLSQLEVAEVMEISVEALESLLARARRALRQMLAAEWRGLLPDPPDDV